MSRVKRSVSSKTKHRKIIRHTSGFIGRRKNVLRIAKQAYYKSLSYHYRDTRNKKRYFRKLWIKTINFFFTNIGLKYNSLIFLLREKNIILNRKILFEILKDKTITNMFLNKIKNILFLSQ